ncbi:MAG: tetratricopeptide repeat protein [Acidobacteriaceae bacterium]
MHKLKFSFRAAMLAAAALSMAFVLQPQAAVAQAPSGSIHGHVNDPIGVSITNGTVKLSAGAGPLTKDSKYQYSFPTDQNGDYKGENLPAGIYQAVLFQNDKTIDFSYNVKVTAGADTTLNFDLSRPDYIAKMTPEQKKQVEEYRKKNATAMAENAKIKNLNTLLADARTNMHTGDYDKAISDMQMAVQAKPDEPLLWYTLGDAQLGAKKYDDAITSYKKSLALNDASKNPKPEIAASADNNLGQALANTGKTEDAVAAYEAAAKLDPTKAGMYYLNEAIVLYKLGKGDEAAAAADKAIAADPSKLDAYYVKGQALIPKTTEDPTTHKFIPPPGCVEAYQKYLELAPTGPHAEEIKQILTGIGQSVTTSYKATKKKKK